MYKNNSTKVWLVINFFFIYSDFKTNPDKKIVFFDLHMIPLEDYFFFIYKLTNVHSEIWTPRISLLKYK